MFLSLVRPDRISSPITSRPAVTIGRGSLLMAAFRDRICPPLATWLERSDLSGSLRAKQVFEGARTLMLGLRAMRRLREIGSVWCCLPTEHLAAAPLARQSISQ